MRTRPRHLPHRATTAHVQAAYPFMAEPGLGGRGVYIGRDLTGGSFVFDPWELYAAGALTGPNMLVIGQLGLGKSALVKTYAWRQIPFGRRVVILDPKREYSALAQAAGTAPIRLEPGGATRLNPLDPRVDPVGQARLLAAITGSALRRPLRPEEHTALDLALTHATRGGEATIPDVVAALFNPTRDAAASVSTTPTALAAASRDVALELRRLCAGELAGMFDEPTTPDVDLSGRLVVLDLASVYQSEALGILMCCTAAWLQAMLATDTTRKTVVVLDEAWAVLRDREIVRWMQASWKMARANGVQNVAVMHRLSDLHAAGDADSEQVQLARGLLSDSETRVIYAQPPGEIEAARELLGLTDTEADLLPRLGRGVALWKVGRRSFLVQHVLGRSERNLVDTDQRMTTTNPQAP